MDERSRPSPDFGWGLVQAHLRTHLRLHFLDRTCIPLPNRIASHHNRRQSVIVTSSRTRNLSALHSFRLRLAGVVVPGRFLRRLWDALPIRSRHLRDPIRRKLTDHSLSSRLCFLHITTLAPVHISTGGVSLARALSGIFPRRLWRHVLLRKWSGSERRNRKSANSARCLLRPIRRHNLFQSPPTSISPLWSIVPTTSTMSLGCQRRS